MSGVAFRWPGASFGQFWGRGVAVRVLGTEEVDGVPSRMVAFLRPDLPAWFRIWVGVEDGLVRREAMLAEGHLMDHRYRDFNGPVGVRPPLCAWRAQRDEEGPSGPTRAVDLRPRPSVTHTSPPAQ